MGFGVGAGAVCGGFGVGAAVGHGDAHACGSQHGGIVVAVSDGHTLLRRQTCQPGQLAQAGAFIDALLHNIAAIAAGVGVEKLQAEIAVFFLELRGLFPGQEAEAAEVIYQRADASKPFMGLKTFRGEMPVLSDVKVAKNYLDENELKILNNLVSGYFDFAEVQAMRHNPMHMADYIEHLDKVLSTTGERQLNGAGSVTHQQAMEKAEKEYRKYRAETLSLVEKAYLKTIRETEKVAKKKARK